MKTIKSVFNAATNGVQDVLGWVGDTYAAIVPEKARKIIGDVAEVALVVAEYSVLGVTALLGVTAASLQVLVYKSQFISYTVQAGDTLESIANRFTMTDRALSKNNPLLRKRGLRPGQKIYVKNRHFIEKDYLNQLQTVLKDTLEKRNLGHWSKKIDKLFAKK